MSLVLQLALAELQNKFQELTLTHLRVRIQDRDLLIYSIEKEQEVHRALLTPYPGSIYMLSIASPHGDWQLIPMVGSLGEMMSILTSRLSFALTRWS